MSTDWYYSKHVFAIKFWMTYFWMSHLYNLNIWSVLNKICQSIIALFLFRYYTMTSFSELGFVLLEFIVSCSKTIIYMLLQKPALLFASSTYNSAAQFNLNQISKDQRAMLHSQNEIVHVFFFYFFLFHNQYSWTQPWGIAQTFIIWKKIIIIFHNGGQSVAAVTHA